MRNKILPRLKAIVSRSSKLQLGALAAAGVMVVASGVLMVTKDAGNSTSQEAVIKTAASADTAQPVQAAEATAASETPAPSPAPTPAATTPAPASSTKTTTKSTIADKPYPTSTVQTPSTPTPRPELTTINTYVYNAPGTQDPNNFWDYNINFYPNTGANSPEGYIITWTVDYASNYNGQATSTSTSSDTFRLPVHRGGYTYNVTICEKKGSGCGVKSEVIKLKAPN